MKLFVVAAAVALAALGVAGATMAFAEGLQLHSCMTESPTECIPSSPGTTIVSSGSAVVESGPNTTECSSESEEEVTNNEGGEEGMITTTELATTFSNCSNELQVLHLVEVAEWLTTDKLYLASKTWKAENLLHINLDIPFIESCAYATSETHRLTRVWTNGNPSTYEVSGSLEKIGGSLLCASELSIGGLYEVVSVSDPELPGVGNVKVS